MSVFHVLNRFLASIGGVLLVVYEFLRIYKSDINPIYDNLYMLDNPYVPFSSFMLLSLTYLFLNMFSFSKNSMSNNLRGFLGCFLVSYSFLFFINQVYICFEYNKINSPKLAVSIYLCVYMFLYLCSLCIESLRSFSKKKVIKEKQQAAIKIEV
ncbi:conserved Plasmodium protein, unknown function [Plasmodium malariae]|uniref:Uncharacterized protein n=1 Tax=Plasmodium malariae TaxID=5858 RepID=A0A1C3KDH3_PLAMA|nr:conserved Plasmodium protein, unknown function [Plasmodium malariae]